MEHLSEGLGIHEILEEHREEILRLADKHGATNVRVFGSVARGEATPESDVDLLVDWDYSRVTDWGGAGLDAELEALLGRKMDIATEKQLRPRIRAAVLEDCVPL